MTHFTHLQPLWIVLTAILSVASNAQTAIVSQATSVARLPGNLLLIIDLGAQQADIGHSIGL